MRYNKRNTNRNVELCNSQHSAKNTTKKLIIYLDTYT